MPVTETGCEVFTLSPAGLDKPPVAFWMQTLSAKLLGFSPFSVLLPQLIEGLAAIVLLYALVRRRFGEPAGLCAALALALTPIAVAVDRSNNTESCRVLVLLLAAGMIGVTVSVVMAIVVLIARLSGAIHVAGYAATTLLIAFFGALNLAGLGIIGAYVWRAFENTKRRPGAVVMADRTFDGHEQ